MGKTWSQDDWHDADELQEAEYRKAKRKKREFVEPEIELGEPKRNYNETFSATTIVKDTYFRKR